jgi:serine/threonine protein kinase
MADHIDGGRLRRKRRKLGRREEDAEFQEEEDVDQNVITSPSSYNFLHLVSLILEHDIPILFPGGWRPRNAYALIGAGGSFLVFKEERTMSDLILSPEQIRSLEERMVLKRTRQHDEKPHHRTDPSSGRYLSIMSELQILLDPDVQAHENIIDLHGLTWDFEPEDNGSFSVWPVLGLEAAECSLQSLMYEYNESEAPLSTRLEYCYNVAAALEFLHARGVAHCDVKLENVLACVTQRSGSMGKLSDFGSAVLGVDKDTFLPTGVAGSPPWNAPEYRRPLRGVEILKLDVFSFGMFLWRFTARSPTFDLLESAGTEREKMIHDLEELKMSESLLRLAIREMNGSYVNSDELDPVIEILEKTLAPFAEQRCSMAEVCSILARAVTLESGADVETENAAGMQEYEPDMHTEELLQNDHTDKDDDSARSVNPILPIPFEPFYNDVSFSKPDIVSF